MGSSTNRSIWFIQKRGYNIFQAVEVWKDIENTEYKISNFGRVASFKFNKATLLRPAFTNKGYLTVSLAINKKQCTKTIHRLVAKAFIDNKENKPHINHKNGIKHDNRVENLEWVTASENRIHAYKAGLQKSRKGLPNNSSTKFKKGDESKRKKQVCLIENNKVVKIFNSVTEAARELGISISFAASVCAGKSKSSKYNISYVFIP